MSVANVVLGALVFVVVIQSVVVLLLFRQVGVLLLTRVNVAQVDGPDVGYVLTEDMGKVVGFEPHADGDGNGQGRTLLLLTRRGCHACETALRGLPGWLGDRDPAPRVLVSGDGMLDLDATTRMRLRASGVVEHESLEALAALGVGVSPFALLLDAAGRVLAKGVLSHKEHLERLESQAEELDADQLGSRA